MVVVYWMVMFVGIMLSAWLFRKGRSGRVYVSIWLSGMVFTVSMLIMIAGIIVGIFMVLARYLKDVPLDAMDPEYDYQKGETK